MKRELRKEPKYQDSNPEGLVAMKNSDSVSVHFTDFFEIEPHILEEYGAFNISLISDMPLFIDPFLIFNSPKPEYQRLHNDIIRYLTFLRDKSVTIGIESGLLRAWFYFGEVKQNWLGFSQMDNNGSGLAGKFASALNGNLASIFVNFGIEQVTRGSHLEKVCLITEGVGRDNISDFTTNLIKEYLLEYTQAFAQNYIRPEFVRRVAVEKVRFNYTTETWERDVYELPYRNGDFVILTPKDILTKDDIWISRQGLYTGFDEVAASISDEQLRAQVNNYFYYVLAPGSKKDEVKEAVSRVIQKFPEVIEYYIRHKEDQGDRAQAISDQKVSETQALFVLQVDALVSQLQELTGFYKHASNTYEEAMARVLFFKDVVENKDGYRLFYVNGKPVKREEDLQLMYRLTWFATPSDVNREVNNGRGPVDYKISRGSKDKSLVEFKLASNTQLKRNLENQVAIYEKASDTDRSIKVILYFFGHELMRVTKILKELGIEGQQDIILIDARSDNKPSASKA